MKPTRFILTWLLIALLLLPLISLAETAPDPTPDPTSEETPEPTPVPTPPFGISLGYDDAQREARDKAYRTAYWSASADGIYVADASDLSLCYFTRHEHETYPPASTTKIMTALLAIEALPMDEIVVTPREATLLGGTNTMLGLVPDEPMRVEDLLYGLMLVSGNDCAITLGCRISGSEEAFAELMNERAAALGMVDTYFTNPSGRNVGDNHSSPYDLAILTQEALKNEQFRKIVATAEHTIPANELRRDPLVIRNSNRLISDGPKHEFYYPDAIGVKTGATALGTCLVSAAKREDVTIIVVQTGLLGDDNEAKRQELFRRAIGFFEYVFTYEYTDVSAETMVANFTDTIQADMPFETDPALCALKVHADPTGAHAFRPVREIDLILSGDEQFDVSVDAHAEAPVKAGQQVGTVTFSYHDRVWFTLPLIADTDLAVPTTPTPTPEPTPEPTEAPTAAPTDTPRPTKEPKPTKTPKPTRAPAPTKEPIPTPDPAASPGPDRSAETRSAMKLLLPIAIVLVVLIAVLLIRKRFRDRD